MNRSTTALVGWAVALGSVATFGAGIAVGASADAATTLPYVKSVRGSADNGWTIKWGDGSVIHEPTLSEELAECGEYSRAVQRARCSATVRTTHRWYGLVRNTLAATR